MSSSKFRAYQSATFEEMFDEWYLRKITPDYADWHEEKFKWIYTDGEGWYSPDDPKPDNENGRLFGWKIEKEEQFLEDELFEI